MIIGVVVILAAAVVVPRLAGATPYTVLTGSMQPDYPPGTLVVVKPAAVDEIGTGDVITYQRESGRATVVTHRVVAVATRSDGEVVLTTKGDANDVVDPVPVREVQVKGRLWYAVPYLGHVNSALNGRQRQVAVLVVSTGLVGYAAFMFVGALRDRRRGRPAAPADDIDIDIDTAAQIDHTPQLDTAATPAPVAAAAPRDLPVAVLAATATVLGLLLLAHRRTRRSGPNRPRHPKHPNRRTKEARS